MLTDDLQQVANAVVRRAQRQGSVRPSDIRSELARTNFPQDQWERVLALSGSLLRYRRGRYYYEARKTSPLEAEEKQQKIIHQTVKQLIRQYKKSHAQMERRRQGRTDYVQPVKVRTEDDREITLLSRDLSEAGIRLIGSCSLLGHKIRVEVPDSEGNHSASFVVRILWTCTVGDGLFENGGMFLEMIES